MKLFGSLTSKSLIGALALGAIALSTITACVYDPNIQRDFDFPVERGDIEMGQQAFVDLGCHQCHTVARTELPDYPIYTLLRLELGGPTSSYKSNAQLLTSLINPNHVISDKYRDLLRIEGGMPLDSPMPNFDHMTVGQLLDIVAFLDSKYETVFIDDED